MINKVKSLINHDIKHYTPIYKKVQHFLQLNYDINQYVIYNK